MYVTSVIPITKSAVPGTLSYFSKKPLPVGAIVSVPVRNRTVAGVVVGSRSARGAKAELRRSDFALRKISATGSARLPREYLEAIARTAEYYASTPGEILSALLPKFLLARPKLLETIPNKRRRRSAPAAKEPLAIQMEADERFGHYRGAIRQSFARGASVLFITPSHEEARRALESLSRGIEEYSFLITSDLTTKAAAKVWTDAATTKHPILLITTTVGLLFDRPDLETVVIERESSSAYRTLSRPFIDWRYFIATLAGACHRELVLGDSLLSITTLYKVRNATFSELSPLKWRMEGGEAEVVDMSAEKTGFRLFSPQLKSLVEGAIEERSGIFLYGLRKGLAPSTICGDCGALLSCLNCRAPMTLYPSKTSDANIYICHHCGMKRDPKTTCANCRSWKLLPLGIGTDLIYKEACREWPGVPVAILDKDHVRTAAAAKRAVDKFRQTGGILIGTELALHYLTNVRYAGIVSLDPLFSLPQFDADERVFRLVSRLREVASHKLIIQTRKPDKFVLYWASTGNIIDFYKNEVEERETLLYPPFAVFVKISGPEIEALQEHLHEWQPILASDSLVIRLKRVDWPNAELSRRLSLLGPEFSIKVDPESIL